MLGYHLLVDWLYGCSLSVRKPFSWLVGKVQLGLFFRSLQTAALVGRSSHAKLVLDHGLEPNAVCKKRDSGKWETGPPVMIAAYMGHFEIVKLFAENKKTQCTIG